MREFQNIIFLYSDLCDVIYDITRRKRECIIKICLCIYLFLFLHRIGWSIPQNDCLEEWISEEKKLWSDSHARFCDVITDLEFLMIWWCHIVCLGDFFPLRWLFSQVQGHTLVRNGLQLKTVCPYIFGNSWTNSNITWRI